MNSEFIILSQSNWATDILSQLVISTLAVSAAILFVLLTRGLIRRYFGPRNAYAWWLLVPVSLIASLVPRTDVISVSQGTQPLEMAPLVSDAQAEQLLLAEKRIQSQIATLYARLEDHQERLVTLSLAARSISNVKSADSLENALRTANKEVPNTSLDTLGSGTENNIAGFTPFINNTLHATNASNHNGFDMGPTLSALVPLALISLWIAGFVISLTRLAFAQRKLVHKLGLLKHTTVNDGPAYITAVKDFGPALVGLMRPRLVLPENFKTLYSPIEQRLILAHERRHMQCGDVQINGLSALLTSVFWFNPLVHYGQHCLQIDQEIAVDNDVITTTQSAGQNCKVTYANALLKAQLSGTALPLGAAWPAKASSPLKARIQAMKTPRGYGYKELMGSLAVALTVSIVGGLLWSQKPAETVYMVETLESSADQEKISIARNYTSATPNPTPNAAPNAATERDARVNLLAPMVAKLVKNNLEDEEKVAALIDDSILALSEVAVESVGLGLEKARRGIAEARADLRRDRQEEVASSKVNASKAKTSFIDEMAAAGLTKLEVDELIALKIHGASKDNIRWMTEIGLADDVDTMIGILASGLDAKYVRDMSKLFGEVDIEALTAMSFMGVQVADVKAWRSAGFRDMNTEDFLSVKAMGLDIDYIKGMQKAGHKGYSIDAYVEAKAVGVTPDYARLAREKGFKDLPLHKLIQLKLADVL